jgi:HD-like signal output (HDOD) protein
MKRILFVDDESKILDGIGRMLYPDRKRWDMQFAVSGEAALRACEEKSFDVVISDMRMPGMDGATLLGHIRDLYPDTARIILSGYSEDALARRAVPVAHRFLAKPISSTELQSAIERVCSLQDALSAEEIRKIVGTVDQLPSLSSTYTRLEEAVNNPDSSINDVAAIIENDIAMSAKVLQLANSAFFGLAQKVTSVSNAVSYLGMATTKNLIVASEAFQAFVPSKRIPQSVCESMEKHAQDAARIASALPLERNIRDIAVIAALLHDIGKLFLASKMPDAFCDILARTRSQKCKPFEAEEELLGTSHAEIGAYLLGLWGLPNLLVEAVAHHHHPTRIQHSGLDSTVAVFLSDILTHELEEHPQGSTELEPSVQACLETLGVGSRFAEFRELASQSLR